MIFLCLQETTYSDFLLPLARLAESLNGALPTLPPSPEGLLGTNKGVKTMATLLLLNSEQVGKSVACLCGLWKANFSPSSLSGSGAYREGLVLCQSWLHLSLCIPHPPLYVPSDRYQHPVWQNIPKCCVTISSELKHSLQEWRVCVCGGGVSPEVNRKHMFGITKT